MELVLGARRERLRRVTVADTTPPAAADPGRAHALVESPLQLLCTVEAHADGVAAPRTVAQVRDDVPSLGEAAAAIESFGLPDGLRLDHVGPLTALAPRAPAWIVGDAFSGVFQTRLLAHGPRKVVLVDDGLATIELARLLVAGSPLTRVGQPAGAARRALGAAATRRLRRLARRGGVVLFTALPLGASLRAELGSAGVRVIDNRFPWLATRPAGATPTEPTIVVGSAMVSDGLVRSQPYVEWIQALARQSPVRYLPHRRSSANVLDALAATPGVAVDTAGAPVEVRLRGLRSGQRVVSLPSTSAVLLTTILAARDVPVVPREVPDSWWTPRASRSLREHLSSVLDLAAQAREAAHGSSARTGLTDDTEGPR